MKSLALILLSKTARFEPLALGLVGWMPGSSGAKVRRIVYRRRLAAMGRRVAISPGVTMRGLNAIDIGDDTEIGQGALINAKGRHNRIMIADRVQARRDAWIDATGEHNHIGINAGARLGWGVRLISSGDHSRIEVGSWTMFDRGVDIRAHEKGLISIGRHVYIGPYVCMGGPGHITIGDNSMVASHCSLYANNHRFADPSVPIKDQGLEQIGITIGKDVWLGSGVRVLDGVTIGDGCVIGAGAVVTKSIPPYSIAVGMPAKVIRTRQPDERVQLDDDIHPPMHAETA